MVDIPFGQRGGIPVNGAQFFPQALVMATADGHPRAIAYTSRLPTPTKAAVLNHHFYADLISVEHDVPMTCPWRIPHQPHSQLLCLRPPGVTLPGLVTSSATLSAAEMAQARADAARMNIGWAVVWKRNQSVASFIVPFLKATGFHFAYRTCGKDSVLVYQRAAHTVTRSGCVA